eukprot:scaffold4846_cov152-Skeletonema_marinoi.AAC.24
MSCDQRTLRQASLRKLWLSFTRNMSHTLSAHSPLLHAGPPLPFNSKNTAALTSPKLGHLSEDATEVIVNEAVG